VTTVGEVVRVCALEELDPGRARRFDIGAQRIAVVRIEDEVFAIGDRCSHEDYSLSEGEVLTEECEIECWKHGSTFDLRTGEPLTLPATSPVPVYDVRLEDGDVMVELP
jgi:3-phenylpropionate/trans-cinnamate dioxygenase ferredoxin component